MEGLFTLSDNNKKFYKLLISLCIPIIIQQLISTSVNIIDTVMISSLGETSVASIGVANQYFFLFNMALSGIVGGSGVFISQFYGKSDRINIKKTTSFTTLLSVGLSAIFVLLATLFPTNIINIFSKDPEVIKLCREYFSIIVFCYPLIAISTVFSMGSRSVRNPRLGMVCSSISLVINIVLNYVFIFGHFGAPALGVKGAAVATVSARIVEFILLILYVYFIKEDYELKFGIEDIKGITKELATNVIKKTTPVFLNDTFWAFGSVLYSVAYATAGTSAMAASQIASTTGNFFIMTAVCIAIGSSIMMGNELGANNIDTAIKYSKKFSVLVTIAGILFGALLIAATPILLKLFSVSDNLAPDIIKIFKVMGVLMALRTFNTFIVIGVLRSGGDTKYSLFLEMGCMWLVSLPITFFAAYKGVPIYILVALTYTEEVAKFIFGVPRAISKKWARNIVDNI